MGSFRFSFSAVIPFVFGVVLLIVGGGAGTGVLATAHAQTPRVATSPPDGSGQADDAIHARQLLVRGMTRAYLEDYDAAIAYFEQALELVPQEASVLAALADAHAAQDDVTSALFYAREARDAAPDNPTYAMRLAALQVDANRPDEAVSTYAALVDRFPEQVDAWLALARLHAEEARPAEALRAYEAALPHGARDRPVVLAEMLSLYRETDNAAGVERTLESLIDLRPADPIYVRLLGRLYARQDRVAEAVALYESLLDDASAPIDVVMHLSTLYRQTGDAAKAERLLHRVLDDDAATADQLVDRARGLYDDATSDPAVPDTSLLQAAERLLRRALDRAPRHAEALDLLGRLRYDAGAYAEAGDLLTRALEQNPRAPERWTQAATAFYRAGNANRAAAVADEGLLLFPGRVGLARVAALALTDLGRTDAALRQVNDALALLDDVRVDTAASTRGSLLAARARLHAESGDATAATTDFEAALAADPTAVDARRHYAAFLAERGAEPDRALDLARQAVEASGASAQALATLGWVQFHRGDLAAARDTLLRAVDAGARDATTLERLGDVHHALGEDAAARRAWQRALDRAPQRDALQQKLQTEQ